MRYSIHPITTQMKNDTFLGFFAFRFLASLPAQKSRKENTQPGCYGMFRSETVLSSELFQFAASFYVDR